MTAAGRSAPAQPRPHVVVVGDVLLDMDVDGRVERLCPDAPVPVLDVERTRTSPGGAGLAALLCAARCRVTLVAPVADDEHGEQLAAQLGKHVTLLRLSHEGATRRKVRVRSDGQSLLRVDDGGSGRPRELPVAELAEALQDADAVLVSDYGAGTTDHPQVRELLAAAAARTHLVWDPHPRGGTPVPGTTLVTPNLSEARSWSEQPEAAGDVAAGALRGLWNARAVCVTAGADGAFLAAHDGQAAFVPAPAVDGGDPCGAGDQFAAAAAIALAGGALLSRAVHDAVQDASAWVANGGAEGFRTRRDHGPTGAEPFPARPATARRVTSDDDGARPADAAGPAAVAAAARARPAATPTDPLPARPAVLRGLATRLRAGGGTLVATGGCFDIIHAGHIATLQTARQLGDHLVVLMNSDASVSRLKGPGRPVVPAEDRARVLAALDCVAAVVIFDDDEPSGALAHLRPDIWAKGGDYGGTPLPESRVLQEHGGRVVLLPYLGGRSTTTIISRSEQAARSAQTATGGLA